jgi:uncharacterized protein YhhL (DUF1145 family)
MQPTYIRLAKTGLIAFWIIAAGSFLIESEASAIFHLAFWAVLAIHFVEFLAFSSLFRSSRGSLGSHFARTLVFGILHILEVRLANTAAEAGES